MPPWVSCVRQWRALEAVRFRVPRECAVCGIIRESQKHQYCYTPRPGEIGSGSGTGDSANCLKRAARLASSSTACPCSRSNRRSWAVVMCRGSTSDSRRRFASAEEGGSWPAVVLNAIRWILAAHHTSLRALTLALGDRPSARNEDRISSSSESLSSSVAAGGQQQQRARIYIYT